MDRITGATTDIGSGRRGFRDRNLGLSQAGTIPGATWFNGAQEEIVRAIELLGLTPTDANREQLIQAMRRLAGGNITSLTANTALTPDNAGVLLVSAASGNVTLTLPAANAAGGAPLRLTIARTDTSANTVTVQRAGADTIEALTALTIPVGGRFNLISDGASAWRLQSGQAPLGGMQIFTSSGTFTVPAGVTRVKVTVIGGGGGGGYQGTWATGGGGSGGTAIRIVSGLVPGSTVAVTVGAGGLAPNTGQPVNGGSGGTSSFGAHCSATGGGGGQGSIAGANAGGGPGSGSGGDLNMSGGYGGDSIPLGQRGGDGAGPGGGRGTTGFATGIAALGYGGGGGGGGSSAVNGGGSGASGGAGAAGVVIVEW